MLYELYRMQDTFVSIARQERWHNLNSTNAADVGHQAQEGKDEISN